MAIRLRSSSLVSSVNTVGDPSLTFGMTSRSARTGGRSGDSSTVKLISKFCQYRWRSLTDVRDDKPFGENGGKKWRFEAAPRKKPDLYLESPLLPFSYSIRCHPERQRGISCLIHNLSQMILSSVAPARNLLPYPQFLSKLSAINSTNEGSHTSINVTILCFTEYQ